MKTLNRIKTVAVNALLAAFVVATLLITMTGCVGENTGLTNADSADPAAAATDPAAADPTAPTSATAPTTAVAEEKSTIAVDQHIKTDLPKIEADKGSVFSRVLGDEYKKEFAGDQEFAEFNRHVNVPFINIDSDDARKFNAAMEKYHLDLVRKYKETHSGGRDMPFSSFFKRMQHGDIASVLVTHSISGINENMQSHSSFNFSTKTGKEISNADLFKKYNITHPSVHNGLRLYYDKLSKGLKNSLSESNFALTLGIITNSMMGGGNIDPALLSFYDGPDHYWPYSHDPLAKNYQYLTIDHNNVLNIVVQIYHPFQSKIFSQLLPVLDQDDKAPINPAFARLSDLKGIDVDSGVEAFIAYVGEYDDLKKLAGRVQSFLDLTGTDAAGLSAVTMAPYVNFTRELYIIVPKYLDEVSLYYADIDAEPQFTSKGSIGNSLLLCNLDSAKPDSIVHKFRSGEAYRFQPAADMQSDEKIIVFTDLLKDVELDESSKILRKIQQLRPDQ